MPFEIKDVLIVNATVIIGLLILLSFQSISSSFIETEASDFMREWNVAKNQYYTTLGLLEDWDCIEDKAAWERAFGHLVLPNPYNYDHVSKEMEGEIKNNCSKWLVGSIEQERHLLEVELWGYNYHYLQLRDEDGNIYTAGTQMDMFYDIQGGADAGYDDEGKPMYVDVYVAGFNPELYIEESEYFKSIVTGPLYVNQWNLFMMVPFIFSAVIASFNIFRKNEETNAASKYSVIVMGFGFIILFIGLMVILNAFVQIDQPFLNQTPEYVWDTSGASPILEPQPIEQITRSEP